MTRLMRRLIIAATAQAALSAAPVARADVLGGLWRLQNSAVELRFQPCGPATCGVIQTSKRIQADPDARDDKNKDERLRSRRLKGVAMLEDLRPAGAAWKGRVYLPANGATYDVTVKRVGDDTLSATGCMAPLLCQTSILNRVP